MKLAAESARIRSLRPPRPVVDPWRPLDVLVEEERLPDGALGTAVTLFLAGSECPFTCVFCDLWRYTLEGPTPVGAIPRQVQLGLGGLEAEVTPDVVKLYNASNFFDPRAVPSEDLPAVARWLRGFARVVVECHPRLVGDACRQFADRLDGRLEVALGLETVHPEAVPRLNKQSTPEDFAAAAERLRRDGIGVRAFVLLAPPYVPRESAVEWAVRSVRFAVECGAELVSVIPVRSGNGEMDRLVDEGLWQPPSLVMLEVATARSLEVDGVVVQADLWDAAALAACPGCRQNRLDHLREMNRSGVRGSVVDCRGCTEVDGGEI